MTKNQINYLLALATLFVLWFYFNTIYVGAKMQSKTGPIPQRSAMGYPGEQPFAQPGYPGDNPFLNRMQNRPNYMQSLPPEAQKMLAERQAAQQAKLASGAASVPVPPVPEKKK